MKLININKKYNDLTVLKDFSLQLEENKICCLLGPSGCGKTTVLNVISNLVSYEGTVEKESGNISYIFQNQRLLPNLNVEKNLEYVLLSCGLSKEQITKKIDNILSIVELTEKKKSYPAQLSGGMQQRVAMARAFIYPSVLLLMDEPFKGLDIVLKKRLVEAFLKLWHRDKKTAIFVTHDIDEALLIADRIVLLSDKAQILMDKFVNQPRQNRDLNNDTMIKIRKDIYKRFV
ncbi:MAG: ABC transporter ATP-binding protein [Bacillota bacterium]